MIESLAKLVIVVSVLAAALAETWAASLAWPALNLVVPAVFAIAWTGSRLQPAIARRLILFGCYLTPAAIVFFRGSFFIAGWMVWLAALLGLIFATAPTLRWSIAGAWKLPLVFWALIAASTWPLILFRENDFRWPIDPTLLAWVTLIALMTMTGILWVDTLCAAYLQRDDATDAFESEIAVPMGAGWLVSGCVAMYQMFGDITFFNPGFWSVLRRTPGTLSDANPFGVISAMWGAALLAIGLESRIRWLRVLGAVALPLSWAAAWASGSRSSLLIVALSTMALVVHAWRRVERRKATLLIALGLPVVAVLFVVAALVQPGGVIGPFARFARDFSPDWSLAWAKQMALNLWTRGNYGPVAEYMIRRFPLTGVGVGAFHSAWYAFSWRIFSVFVPADNAQNWYRHELAELGIVGSLGWIAWSLSFVWLLSTSAARSQKQLTATILRAALVGYGLISLVGVPGQDVAVVFTFWTMAFWFVRVLVPTGGPDSDRERPKMAKWLWPGALALVVAYTGATAYAAWTELRPPIRACNVGMPYSYGQFSPEGVIDGAPYRWAEQQSVASIQVSDPWLEVTVWVDHGDVASKPVDVFVWADRRRLLKARLSSTEPVTRYYKLPPGSRCVILETSVNRVVRSGKVGSPGRRNHGLLVAWKPIDKLPPGAVVLQ